MRTQSRIGVTFRWGATHKRGGRLISRHTSLDPPDIGCPNCWLLYPRVAFLYLLLNRYHVSRVKYAEEYPDLNIKWKYRTGEDSPEKIGRAIWELILLKTRRKMTWLKTKL